MVLGVNFISPWPVVKKLWRRNSVEKLWNRKKRVQMQLEIFLANFHLLSPDWIVFQHYFCVRVLKTWAARLTDQCTKKHGLLKLTVAESHSLLLWENGLGLGWTQVRYSHEKVYDIVLQKMDLGARSNISCDVLIKQKKKNKRMARTRPA